MQLSAFRGLGSVSNIERVFLYKDAGAADGTEADPLTGLTSASAGLIISTMANNESVAVPYTQAAGNIEGITTLGTFAAPTAGKVRFKEVDATNHPGLYEIQIADARYAVTDAKYLDICISGAADLAPVHLRIYQDIMDPAGIRAALGLAAANLDTQLSDKPSNQDLADRTLVAAEYATADAVQTVDAVVDAIAAAVALLETASIKAKTDQLAFTEPGYVDANVLRVEGQPTGVIVGEAVAGTLLEGQATTDLSGYTADQLVGRRLVVLTGDADGEATVITDFDPTGGLLSFDALTVSMAVGDKFKIV